MSQFVFDNTLLGRHVMCGEDFSMPAVVHGFDPSSYSFLVMFKSSNTVALVKLSHVKFVRAISI